MHSWGMSASTRVQADRHCPSMTTSSPESRMEALLLHVTAHRAARVISDEHGGIGASYARNIMLTPNAIGRPGLVSSLEMRSSLLICVNGSRNQCVLRQHRQHASTSVSHSRC
jgi:hypothetical protein